MHIIQEDHLYILKIIMDPKYFPEEYYLVPPTKMKIRR